MLSKMFKFQKEVQTLIGTNTWVKQLSMDFLPRSKKWYAQTYLLCFFSLRIENQIPKNGKEINMLVTETNSHWLEIILQFSSNKGKNKYMMGWLISVFQKNKKICHSSRETA